MKLRLIATAIAALTLGAGVAAAQDSMTEQGKLSYALGYNLGRNAIESGEALDMASVNKGLQDGYAKRDPSVPVDQLRVAVENMQKRQAAKSKAAWDKASAENTSKSAQYLAQNKAQAGVKTLPNGVQYRVIQTGTGAKPTMASTVELSVAGPFPWGQRPAEAQAQQIPAVKLSEVEMAAMRDVLVQMQPGAKWEVVVPAAQAYGADPRSGFPPNVAVLFDIQLLGVK